MGDPQSVRISEDPIYTYGGLPDRDVIEQNSLNASFDVSRRRPEDHQEIVEQSLQEPDLPREILEDRPVEFYIIQNGSQKKNYDRITITKNNGIKKLQLIVRQKAKQNFIQPARQFVDEALLDIKEENDHQLPCLDLRIDDQRHLLSALPSQLQLLSQAKRWFCDGTFKTFLPIVVDPCLYPQGREHKARSTGARLATREVFPDPIVKGCAFHFSQAVWRKTQELGLKTTYSERGNPFHSYLQSTYLQPSRNFNKKLRSHNFKKLTSYVHDTWMTSTVWMVEHWTVFMTATRTNNNVEGRHNRLNTKAHQAQLPFYVLVPKVLKEAKLLLVQCKMVSEEKLQRHQRKHTRQLQYQLFQLWDQNVAAEITDSQLLGSNYLCCRQCLETYSCYVDLC
ncbi:hypothetical protein KUTeg_023890 [Tegillarca granosa]|uniref:MULE transposase domain-containing protein n=1 Tax=Tegillarca granosa TaxID=220873 RepID=A0ABQ9E3U8_TEGGR|nr:hypothetical protein KUTeg_023890 [Tegillarca granosa]